MDSMDVEANLPWVRPYSVNGFLRQWEGCCPSKKDQKIWHCWSLWINIIAGSSMINRETLGPSGIEY